MEFMKKAGELMIPLEEYPHVPYWFTLRQVMAIMEKTKSQDPQGGRSLARFVLVFNEGYKLLGIIRRRDILRGLELDIWPAAEPPDEKPDEKNDEQKEAKEIPGHREIPPESLIKKMGAQAEHPVSEVMLPIRATVDFKDDIMKVIHEMVKNNLSMIPVLQDDRVVGVVRSVEVFHEIAQLIL